MKGVILGICPSARFVDLSHAVEPGDVRGGALLLWSAVPYFPAGTIHLAVVDPGVGGDRDPLAIRSGGQAFVGPDNGLLWAAAARVGVPQARRIENPAYRLPHVSHTFHGRDVFAPATAHLALGVPWESLGAPVPEPVRWELPVAQVTPEGITGEVLAVDRFGNVITNLTPGDLAPLGESWRMEVGPVVAVGPAAHYGAAGEGEPLVVLGSLGFYEMAVNRGNAAARYGVRRGDRVRTSRSS
jgi:S-adenosylmethionine hydrolase